MITTNKLVLLVLLVLNAIVLLGQLWPEGVPPFARVINIITLGSDVLLLSILYWKSNPSQ